MKHIKSITEMQNLALQCKQQSKRIALVPTMGFLHEGHLALVDTAKQHADVVVMSIFVNPTQFGPQEDFESYPRNLEQDQKLAHQRGVDFLFTPTAQEVYPEGDQSVVLVTELTRGLCGPFRPGHFRGVTTVVAKLFLMVQPDVAVFGEKDYQQLKVIQRMVRDLHFPIQIIGVPTVRESDGLAMSSRNTYLSSEERKEAAKIYATLQSIQEQCAQGEKQVSVLLERAKAQLGTVPNLSIEYLEFVDAETLATLTNINREARVILALHLNGKRLIDNVPLKP